MFLVHDKYNQYGESLSLAKCNYHLIQQFWHWTNIQKKFNLHIKAKNTFSNTLQHYSDYPRLKLTGVHQ